MTNLLYHLLCRFATDIQNFIMSNEVSLQKFISQDFGEVRGLEYQNQPWLVGKNIAICLGYKKPENALIAHVDSDDKTTTLIQGDGSNYKSKSTIVNESGFYSLVFGSKLPTAKKFKHWVTSEVLPSINKHGIYATDGTLDSMLNNPDFGIRLLTELKNERGQRKQLENQLQQQKPLIDFATTVKGSDINILVRETSKLASNYTGIDIGERGLYQKLREWGFVCWTHNEPTKRAYKQKILEYVERKIRIYPYVDKTCMVTPHGQIYIINRLIKESVLAEGTVA